MSGFFGDSAAVTGAGGSIGFQVCRQLLSGGVDHLKMISLTEAGLYDAHRRLKAEFPHALFVPILGSYGNRNLMTHHLKGVDLVIHAGAHKHVPMCENNPLEAIANNVLGTDVLLQIASEQALAMCVISSDKAVNPTSVMGATKRVVEKLAMRYAGRTACINAVRFGNVMDSAGSVIPLWREQIANGGPITLTDERCERYFMTIPDAVELVMYTILHGGSRQIYMLNMGERVKLIDVARRMIAESGKDIEIVTTGLRPGEKLIEELSYDGTFVPLTDKISMVQDHGTPLDPQDLDDIGLAYRLYDTRKAVALLKKMAS